MQNGVRCYSCKDEIHLGWWTFKKSVDNKNTPLLCQSCERNNNIDMLFSRKKGQIILSLKKFLLIDKYTRIQQKISITCMPLPIAELVVRYAFDMKQQVFQLTDISNIINIFIWIFMIFQIKYITIKKIK
jgi:hypothetical protein